MKLVVVAGTPGSGKTSVIMHAISFFKRHNINPAVVKIDCLFTDDHKIFNRANIPVQVGLSRDMCPDHFAIYNMENMVQWGKDNNADIIINETAGLCLRCAPYSNNCIAVCVVDVTTGPNTPMKIGPMLTTADIVIATKGDIVSQAEREVFRECVYECNPNCYVIEANGLSGQGMGEFAEAIINKSCDVDNNVAGPMALRRNAPLAICTLCCGELRLAKKHHFGILRSIDGMMEYKGE